MGASDELTGRMWREGDAQDTRDTVRRQMLEMDHWRSNPALAAFLEPYFARMAEACANVCRQLIETRNRVGATTDDKLNAQGMPMEFTPDYADQVRAFTRERRVFHLIRGLDNVLQSRQPGIRIGSAVETGNREVTYTDYPSGGYVIRKRSVHEFPDVTITTVELHKHMKEKGFSPDLAIPIPANLIAHILPLDPSVPNPDFWFNTQYYADGTLSPYAGAGADDGSALLQSIVEIPHGLPY